jgi:hypothetical protein
VQEDSADGETLVNNTIQIEVPREWRIEKWWWMTEKLLEESRAYWALAR